MTKSTTSSPSGEPVMTVEEWLQNISSLVKEFPEVLQYAVVGSQSGHQFGNLHHVSEVTFYPQVGKWNPMTGEFNRGATDDANALCID